MSSDTAKDGVLALVLIASALTRDAASLDSRQRTGSYQTAQDARASAAFELLYIDQFL